MKALEDRFSLIEASGGLHVGGNITGSKSFAKQPPMDVAASRGAIGPCWLL